MNGDEHRNEGAPAAPGSRPAAAAVSPILALALAATLVGFLGVSVYAWLLQTELSATRESVAAMSDRIDTLRTQLTAVRQGSGDVTRLSDVMDAPELRRIELSGQPGGPGAIGRAFVGTGVGLVVRARRLPVPATGRGYQVWLTPAGGTAPVSVGVFRPDGSGTLDLALALPPGVRDVEGIALTEEPTAGADRPAATAVLEGSGR